MRIRLNEHFEDLEEQYLFSGIAQRIAAYRAAHPEKRILRLGVGDVTLPLGRCVVEALRRATDEMGEKKTFRGYAPESGYDFLREAISADYAGRGVRVDAGEVFVSDGAKSTLGNLTDLFGENEILIPDPAYPVYADSYRMCGSHIVRLPATEENGFLPLPREIPATEPPERAYIICLCSPNNPTGAVYCREALEQWVQFARRTGSLILFDAAYEAYITDPFPHSVYEIEGARFCAVEICSLSKSAGFTGMRCGWCVFPEELQACGVPLSTLWKRRQATKFNGVPYVIQRAAEAALSPKGRAESMQNVRYYMENAAKLSAFFAGKGIRFCGGRNAPYLWIRCPEESDAWSFFDLLLERVQVVGTPGCGFGAFGNRYFRLSAFADHEDTEEAIARMERLL